MAIPIRFCSKYIPEQAINECQCRGTDDAEPHIFFPTGTYYECAYGTCQGYKCQLCDKFEVVG